MLKTVITATNVKITHLKWKESTYHNENTLNTQIALTQNRIMFLQTNDLEIVQQ